MTTKSKATDKVDSDAAGASEGTLSKLADKQATPVVEEDQAEEMTHGLVLACGCLAEAPNPNANKHFCTAHNVTVPIKSVFEL